MNIKEGRRPLFTMSYTDDGKVYPVLQGNLSLWSGTSSMSSELVLTCENGHNE